MRELYKRSHENPILGQECICPDGLGRVMSFDLKEPNDYIQVQTYINSRDCKWSIHNVTLIPIYI